MTSADFSPPPSPDLNYNRPQRKNRSTRHYMRRRALKRRLTKAAFFAVVVGSSLLAAYLLAG